MGYRKSQVGLGGVDHRWQDTWLTLLMSLEGATKDIKDERQLMGVGKYEM